jgi:hypothetical protein
VRAAGALPPPPQPGTLATIPVPAYTAPINHSKCSPSAQPRGAAHALACCFSASAAARVARWASVRKDVMLLGVWATYCARWTGTRAADWPERNGGPMPADR